MSSRRFALVLALFVAFAACTVLAVLRVVAPAPAPSSVRPQKPLTPRLSQHVLFVIVDGLRYDVATDPARMPRFAEAMARETSAEIWAGRVSMTTSAVVAIGTGQRGRLEQVVRNLSPGLAPHNSWLQNAQAAGARVVAAGDPAWFQCYGPSLFQHRDDPGGVAIDVDFNPQTFRNTRELLALEPDLLIAHFVTPDHQGHAYGVVSERYRAHIRAFDEQLHTLLAEVGPDWTLIVTSDHGASDAGKHGTDVAVQRKSPIYARGPGIRSGIKLQRPLDQLELAATIPSLLGVSAPAHRTGHVTAEWLDVPAAGRAEAACTNAEQVLSYALQVAPPAALQSAQGLARACRASNEPDERSALAERSLAESDRAIERSVGLLSAGSLPWLVSVVALGLALVFAVAPSLAVLGLPAIAVTTTVIVLLVFQVERLPGIWPDTARVLCLIVGNLGLLLLLVRPQRLASLLGHLMPHAPAMAPGFLVLSYPADTRPEAYVALVVCVVVYVAWGGFRAFPFNAAVRLPRLAARDAIPAICGLLALLPVVLHENEGFSRLLEDERLRPFFYSALLCVWFVWQRTRAGERLSRALAFAALATVCFALRVHTGPLLGRLVWAVSGLTFLACSLRGSSGGSRSANAAVHANVVSAGSFAFAWLARDFELLPVLGAATLAIVVGDHLSARLTDGGEPENRAADLMVQSLFVFALAFTVRMGIQDGLEFGGLDFHAGAFAAPDVSAILVGVALAYKYALAFLVVVFALSLRLPLVHRSSLAAALVACFVARTLSLLLMFFFCGNSYWTALRVLGDLPASLAIALGAVLARGSVLLPLRRSRAARADDLDRGAHDQGPIAAE